MLLFSTLRFLRFLQISIKFCNSERKQNSRKFESRESSYCSFLIETFYCPSSSQDISFLTFVPSNFCSSTLSNIFIHDINVHYSPTFYSFLYFELTSMSDFYSLCQTLFDPNPYSIPLWLSIYHWFSFHSLHIFLQTLHPASNCNWSFPSILVFTHLSEKKNLLASSELVIFFCNTNIIGNPFSLLT